MGELVLVRHAQASFGSADYDRLSPLGHRQAGWLGAYLAAHEAPFDRVICGGLRRHRETCAPLSGAAGMPAPQIDPRFDEFPFAELFQHHVTTSGQTPPDSRAAFVRVFPGVLAAWEEGRIGAGLEAHAAFRDRVLAATRAAIAPGGRVLVVTSGGVIGTVLRDVLGLGPAAAAEVMVRIHNASIHRLSLEDGALRLGQFNAIPHLDPKDRAHARTFV